MSRAAQVSSAAPPPAVDSPRRERTSLVLLVVSALALPVFVLYADHVDSRWAQQPADTIVFTGLHAPLLTVPAGVLLAWLSRRWSVLDKFVASGLALGWIGPYLVATATYGCDDSGGSSAPCSLTTTSSVREVGIVVIAVVVLAVAAWLQRRASDPSR